MPVPILVIPPEPPITPANVVEPLLPPVVKRFTSSNTEVPATPASEPISSLAFTSRTAPEVSRLTATVSSSAEPASSVRVPPETIALPVKVLTPDRVNVPVPVLVIPPEPLITPPNVVESLFPPVVRVLTSSNTEVPAAPASEPISSSAFTSRIAPDALRMTATVSSSAEPPSKASVPALTVTSPRNVLAPESTRVPSPTLSSVAAPPPTTAEIVAVFPLETLIVDPLLMDSEPPPPRVMS